MSWIRHILLLTLLFGALALDVDICQSKIVIDDGQYDLSWIYVPKYSYPTWATEPWIDYAAHIVASESRNVPTSDLPIACTIVRDVTIRNYHPWNLHGNPGRWHGYGHPDIEDYAAIRLALVGGCDEIPNFRYFGCMNDMGYFMRHGYVEDQPLSLYIGTNGSMVVGIP